MDDFQRGAQADLLTRAKRVPIEIGVSAMDGGLGHTWPRLDPSTLEENWLRLQNPRQSRSQPSYRA